MDNSNISKDIFNRLRFVTAYDHNQREVLDADALPSMIDSYKPTRRASFNLALNLPKDPTSIQEYRRCVNTPVRSVPYFNKPQVNSEFPLGSHDGTIAQQKYSSLLPLLITAQHAGVNVSEYDVVSERSSFRKIAMNKEDYIVGVKRYGSTLFLRRYDKQKVDPNALGFQFEKMCTPDYHRDCKYMHLIEGKIGAWRTLITAEIDAVSKQDNEAIELKCRLNSSPYDKRDCWLQAFLSGVTTVWAGYCSNGKPPQLTDLVPYEVSTMIDNQEKVATVEYLYQVLRFLRGNVKPGRTYLLSCCDNQQMQKGRLCLFEVVNRQDEQELEFISERMLKQLAVDDQSWTRRDTGRESDILTNYPSRQSIVQVKEVEASSVASTTRHQISANTNTAAVGTGSYGEKTTDDSFNGPLQKTEHQISMDDDYDDPTWSRSDSIDFICETKDLEESILSEQDRAKKKKEENAYLRRRAGKSETID